MIKKLTKRQEEGIQEWYNKCLKIGYDTSPIDKATTEKSWKLLYKKLKLKEPNFIYCQSPMQAQVTINKIKKNKKYEFIHTYSWCQHDISWIAYYKFYKEYGLLPHDDNFEIIDIWFELAKSCGWCYTFENTVFVCEKPNEIHLNDNKQLHHNSKMALTYSDGYGLYMLNGVNVPKYLVETPAEKLSMDFYKKEKNADVKAEFIRKYGMDRMASMGKVIDTWKNYKSNKWWVESEYELIDMSPIFESIKFAPHIKMKNLTTGIYHMEAVAPDNDTLEKAMKFRQNDRDNLNTINIK